MVGAAAVVHVSVGGTGWHVAWEFRLHPQVTVCTMLRYGFTLLYLEVAAACLCCYTADVNSATSHFMTATFTS